MMYSVGFIHIFQQLPVMFTKC